MAEQYMDPEELFELENPYIVAEPHPDAEPGELSGEPTDVPADGTVFDSDDVVDSNWPDGHVDDASAVDRTEVM
jgi:hypothetical protein